MGSGVDRINSLPINLRYPTVTKVLTPENYYEPDGYMSVSAFKQFKKCELVGLSGFGESTESMLVGSYVDAWVEGTLDKFKEQHPDIISSRGATKGQLKSEFKKAEEIIDHIKNNKRFMQFMSGEKQTIMTGFISGVPFKIKMDSYSPGIAINDLKVMKSVTTKSGDYYDFITPWGYDIQGGGYQEIVRQNTGLQLPVFICAVTKEDPVNSVIVQIPQYVLDKALGVIMTEIEHYYDVKLKRVAPVGCGKCKTCIGKRTESPLISMEDFIDFLGG